MPRRRRWLVAALVLAAIPCLALVPCAQQIRNGDGWVGSANSLKVIGLALQAYHEVYGHLPPAVVRDRDGRPLYSWRVEVLPFLEQNALYKRFRRDEPWDGPNNRALLGETPQCYLHYPDKGEPPGTTRYQVVVGPGTAFERDRLTWADFPNGPAGTILVAEAQDAVPWSKPADLAYDPGGPLPALGGEFRKPVRVACYVVRREPGFVAVFGDGQGRFVPAATDEATVRAALTRDGARTVDPTRFARN